MVSRKKKKGAKKNARNEAFENAEKAAIVQRKKNNFTRRNNAKKRIRKKDERLDVQECGALDVVEHRALLDHINGKEVTEIKALMQLGPLPKRNPGMKNQGHWEPPPEGYVKMNVDGSLNQENENCPLAYGGHGGCFRDHLGIFEGGFCRRTKTDVNGKKLKSTVIECEGVSFGANEAFLKFRRGDLSGNVICETDCVHVFQRCSREIVDNKKEIVEDGKDDTKYVRKIQKIYLKKRLHPGWNLMFCLVTALQNKTADTFAKEGYKYEEAQRFARGQAPSFALTALMSDIRKAFPGLTPSPVAR